MGQAILRNHLLKKPRGNLVKEFDSVGFWASSAGGPKGIPTTDTAIHARLAFATGMTRQSEPGLSLIVPHVLRDIEPHHLVSATLRNYYYPILAHRLIVVVNGEEINAATFDSISTHHGDSIAPSVLSFVKHLLDERTSQPGLVLPAGWQTDKITGDWLGSDVTEQLRARYKAGEMLTIRAPVTLNKIKPPGSSDTFLDVFLKLANPGEKAQTLVVRGSITVPTEGKKATLPECHAALIADDDAISQFLGDAENPAHTQWNERAEKLKLRWKHGPRALRRVRALLHEIHAVVADRIEREDHTALVDFFSVPKPKRAGASHKTTHPLMPKLAAAKPKPFRIEKRGSGFSILPQAGLSPDSLPLKINVRCAYDVLSGNPFRRFSDYDFSFFKGNLSVDKTNAESWPTDHNAIDVEARSADFRIDVHGFDPNRDLIIEAQG